MSKPRSLLGRLRWLISPGESLGSRAVNAGAWAFVLNMTTRVLRLVRVGILANLLAPNDFGLMGIAMLVIGLVTSFTQTGFISALVQNKRGLDRTYLDTAWTVELGRGVGVAALMVLAAPLVGDFFGDPQATDLTRLMALGLAISGLTNTGVVAFDKDLEFQRRFLYRATPHVVELVVGVVLALMWRNAWALAWGWVAGRAALTIASYVTHPHRPRLRFDRGAARSMFGFGVWTLASQVLLYFTLHIDDIVVGRIISPLALGLYQMAYTMSQLTTTEITTVVNQVAFPAYSSVQDQPARLARAYSNTLQLISVAAWPMAAGLYFVGPTAIETFLGADWLPMLPAFNVLLLWGLIRSIAATTGPLLRGAGRPSILTRIQAAHLLLLAVLIYPMTSEWGIAGAAWATVVAAILPDIFAMWITSRVSTAPLRSIGRALAIPGAAAGLMLATLVAARSAGFPADVWLLVWAPILGAGVYLLTTLAARRWLGFLPDGLLPAGR
jgi:lipopolysaccharide exporter